MAVTAKDMLPVIAWSTIANNVIKLTDWTYQVTVHPINISEPGAGIGEMAIGDYIVANTGRLYSITGVDGENITVNDDFETGLPPWSGLSAIVFRSVGEGQSLWLPPIRFEVLDKCAKSYLTAIIQEILYRNKGDVGKLIYPDDFSTASVSYNFKNYYKEIPEGRENIRVYRKDQPAYEGASELRDAEVLWHTLIVDNEHFELTIDTTITPDLTGVVVYFNFNSAT